MGDIIITLDTERRRSKKEIGKKYKISYIENYLYNYRMHNSNKTKQKKYENLL